MAESREDKAISEIQKLYETMSKVQYELTWFPFKVGQLGAVAQLGPEEGARMLVESMRTDINDFMDSAEACALQMGKLLVNVEESLNEKEEDDGDEPEAA